MSCSWPPEKSEQDRVGEKEVEGQRRGGERRGASVSVSVGLSVGVSASEKAWECRGEGEMEKRDSVRKGGGVRRLAGLTV
jgi:hypothetical protein